jgi:hypothetical protein
MTIRILSGSSSRRLATDYTIFDEQKAQQWRSCAITVRHLVGKGPGSGKQDCGICVYATPAGTRKTARFESPHHRASTHP